VSQHPVLEEKRISTREEDILDFRVVPDVLQPGRNGFFCHNTGFPHLPFSVAESAINGTPAGDQKKDPVGIPVGQAGNRGEPFFVKGIFVAGRLRDFADIGNALSVDGVPFLPDKPEVIGIDAHGIAGRDLMDGVGVYAQAIGEGPGSANAACEDLLPGVVLPLFFDDGEQSGLL
jgi:hypothetical protein